MERFHDPASPKAEAGTAFIPEVTKELQGLWQVNRSLLEFVPEHQPAATATLDMDATLIETHKRDALFCYKKFKAYQPLNCWWAELRSDTAGYQEELLPYCGEGKDPRFGVIEFAIGADVTGAFRAAVLATAESEWKPLIRRVGDKFYETDQEWAEVGFVPNRAGHSRERADYRFLAIREPPRQLAPGDQEQPPFPTQEFGRKGLHELFGVVTNRKGPGDGVIWWLRERCGKSEEVHSALKSDLAGGQMPSGLFGANAAWRALSILAFNLNAAMRRLALGKDWRNARMKAPRFPLIGPPGRDKPRPQADHPFGRREASVGDAPRCAREDARARSRTGGMIENTARPTRNRMSATADGGRHAEPAQATAARLAQVAHDRCRTRGARRPIRGGERKPDDVTLNARQDRKIGQRNARAEICSRIVGFGRACVGREPMAKAGAPSLHCHRKPRVAVVAQW